MSALATPPVDIKPSHQDLKPTHEHLPNTNGHVDVKPNNASGSGSGSRSRESSGSLSPPPASMPIKSELGLAKDEPIDIDMDEDDIKPKVEDDKVKVEEQKRKYDEEEKKLRDLEPPPVQRVQDDWQVAYVWAFIVKFNQKDRIRGLESIEDFEKCLIEPVAIRPDDVLEGILIQFLKNLRPALRNLSAETIQTQLSNYFNDQLLNSTEFTVWDRAWAANEEVRGGCCNSAEDRMELGRLRYIGEPVNERVGKNPIKKQVDKGGGIFEMDWRDRAKMLRQLVDWQLVHSEVIKGAINKEAKIPGTAAKKEAKGIPELVPDGVFVKVEPLGHDRDKNRIWSFDNSVRIYKSGNPYKRPCPLIPLTTTRAEFDSLTDTYAEHGAKEVVKPEGKGPKGKLTAAQSGQYKKALKGKEDEGKLAEKLKEMIPAIEKEEARIQRAKKRVEQAANLASMAEWRSTRTRRPTRKIDYSYGDEPEDEEVEEAPTTLKRRRGEPEYAHGLDDRGRAIIPGERRSARTSAKDDYAPDQDEGNDQDDNNDEGQDDEGSNSDQEIEAVLPPNGHGNGDGNTETVHSSNGDSPPPYSAPSESMDVE